VVSARRHDEAVKQDVSSLPSVLRLFCGHVDPNAKKTSRQYITHIQMIRLRKCVMMQCFSGEMKATLKLLYRWHSPVNTKGKVVFIRAAHAVPCMIPEIVWLNSGPPLVLVIEVHYITWTLRCSVDIPTAEIDPISISYDSQCLFSNSASHSQTKDSYDSYKSF
jgi:hypothetical protein